MVDLSRTTDEELMRMATPPASTASVPRTMKDMSDQELMDMSRVGFGGAKTPTAGDIAMGGLTALASGSTNAAFAIPGIPGSVDELASTIGTSARDAFRWMHGLPPIDTPVPRLTDLPTIPETQKAANEFLGTTPHQPENTLEEGLNTIGSFIPGAGFGAGGRGLVQAGKTVMEQAVIPGVATESAGQLTRLVAPDQEDLIRGVVGVASGLRGAEKSIPPVQAPSIDDLKKTAGGLYDQAHAQGLRVAQVPYANALNDIVKMADPVEGLDTKSFAAAQRILRERGTSPTLESIDNMRQIINRAVRDGEDADASVALGMRKRLDEFLDNLELHPEMVISGNPKAAIETIKKARKLWARQERADVIGEAIRLAGLSAQGQRGGIGLALRNEFAKIARKRDLMATFPKTEQNAILTVAQADRPEQVIAFFASLSPERRSGLAGLATTAAAVGAFSGRPEALAFLAPTSVGQIAQNFLNRRITREAQRASGLARGGKNNMARYGLPVGTFLQGNMAVSPPGGGGGF